MQKASQQQKEYYLFETDHEFRMGAILLCFFGAAAAHIVISSAILLGSECCEQSRSWPRRLGCLDCGWRARSRRIASRSGEVVDTDELMRVTTAATRSLEAIRQPEPSRDEPHARPCTPGAPPGRLGANQERPAARGL